ncbi:sigma-54-dependent Fis family transcriptional regulator [Enterococcus camelliae]|uniref:Sigma-54-dependent Fis family transcriptional regulator n=1 Tax=Enterococcus camelliae TaxID=453959 RepID=A0ABW5TKA3_9ENTE
MEKQIWKQFVNGETRVLTQLPSKIANSWQFCLQNHVDPFLVKPPKMLTQGDLAAKQQENRDLIQVVKNELNRVDKRFHLESQLFILTDSEANIIWRTGNYQARDFANEIAFREGSNWSELEVGTNAIGLAIRSKEDECLALEEHYSAASRKWSCSASPILDENNEIVGVLDISTYQNSTAKDSFLLLTMLTQKISNQLMKQHIKRRNELLEYAKNFLEEVIFCDSHFRIIQVPIGLADQFHIGEDIRKVVSQSMIYDQESIVQNRQLIGYKYKLYQVGKEKEAKPYYPGVPTRSSSYQKFLDQVIKVSSTAVPIHIYGESGSGKEIISQTIHRNSLQKDGPLIAINCGAVSENLLESELFGYAPGAFTGANAKGFEGKLSQANGGTLFLDEIDSMPEKMQQSLLRVLEDKMVTPISGKPVPTDFRLVTASNKDLRKLVQEGKFREDLFYRLFVCTVRIPPLRERMEDIQPLIERFMEKNNWSIKWESKLEKVAMNYPWYGNIREFNNFLSRVAIFYPQNEPEKEELETLIQTGSVHVSQEPLNQLDLSTQNDGIKTEKQKIEDALVVSHYNMTKAAETLNISRATLYRKMKKYELSV